MVSFVCDGCQQTIKKPKLAQHYARCQSPVTCVDCYTMFSGNSWSSHTSCISEAQKVQGNLYRGSKSSVRYIRHLYNCKSSTKATAASQLKTDAPKASASSQQTETSTQKESSKKRAREGNVDGEEGTVPAKKPKLAEIKEDSKEKASEEPALELQKLLKAKRVVKKLLKKAEKKTMDKVDLKDQTMQQLRSKIEAQLSQLADDAIAKFEVSGDKVTLRK